VDIAKLRTRRIFAPNDLNAARFFVKAKLAYRVIKPSQDSRFP